RLAQRNAVRRPAGVHDGGVKGEGSRIENSRCAGQRPWIRTRVRDPGAGDVGPGSKSDQGQHPHPAQWMQATQETKSVKKLGHGWIRMNTDNLFLSVFIRVHPWPKRLS